MVWVFIYLHSGCVYEVKLFDDEDKLNDHIDKWHKIHGYSSKDEYDESDTDDDYYHTEEIETLGSKEIEIDTLESKGKKGFKMTKYIIHIETGSVNKACEIQEILTEKGITTEISVTRV